MRFRSKLAWVPLATAMLYLGISFGGWKRHHATGIREAYVATCFLWGSLGLFSLASYFLVWWDLDDTGITQRRLWSRKFVPWHEITHIGPWQPGKKPIYNTVAIDYLRTAPLSDRGSFLIQQPSQRDALLASLHSHAPQAIFDL
jgi:hypothetical protein